MIENSLSVATNGIKSFTTTNSENIIGKVRTDENGTWSLAVNVYSPGKYSFNVYENYGKSSQLKSQNYTYDISLENKAVELNIGPSPFNPKKESLKIEYTPL